MIFLSATASPTPMFRVILVIRGTCMGFFRPSFFWISPASSLLNFSFKRAIAISLKYRLRRRFEKRALSCRRLQR